MHISFFQFKTTVILSGNLSVILKTSNVFLKTFDVFEKITVVFSGRKISSNIHLIAELHSIRYSWLFPRKLLLKHTFHHQYYPYHRIMPALSHDHDGFREFPNSILPFSKKHTTFFPKAYYLFINSIVPILKSNHSFSCNAKCFS